MSRIGDWMHESAHDVRVAAESDVVVVGGGPAGQAAALAAARNGASVTLLERYNHLGGLASGGMVLVLDDMWDSHLQEISVRGICLEMIERMAERGLAEYPKQKDWGSLPESVRRWKRWGTFDFHSKEKPHPICFAAAFDPDAFKRASLEMVLQANVNLRLHSWFSRTLVEDGQVKGVICESKSGREAILGKVVIDATGDLDVAASAGAPHVSGAYIVTTVFRLGGVDTEEAERFEHEEPAAFQAIDREVKHLLGGAWDSWWLKTPLPGVVWCNCPHMAGLDGLKVADLTRAEVQGRATIHKVIEFIRAKLPGFADCYLIDLAPQTGVRQTRLLEGEYVMSKDDVTQRVRFEDSVARGRDYYYPYRSLVPRSVENLLVAGRHYSSTSAAQKISREIPPCMAMGEAAGTAAALALDAGVTVRKVDVAKLQRTLRAQGADPGDQKGPNADVPEIARSFAEAA
ncbi:FAD-dependent oxidoreductase [Variovorax ginsengisoli]|uniref:FAD-dependent oxidoreductase n=1 Tax=Variovorax ginsengisoli TaxID=363844 RepID=A0ABT8SH58_9BURK|nr:FAD-dependent oxidoreductase [Variovorax ginsengisoli]MDN8618554.1 FAD-dependent oxidoreductase [Variovorax ginsengisoli]MDO1537724.1 FAD-dependent oxidoreductase [Variovorax ginsengisoli]